MLSVIRSRYLLASGAFLLSSVVSPLLFAATPDKPKNIIMVVADGMGPAYTSAYRFFSDNPDTPEIETTVFDELLVGGSSTYPASVSGLVTDSAASATALASGVKTYNGAIGLDENKQPVNTVLREAKRRGKRTGLAVTSQIVHATPASYVARNQSRQNYNEIADSFFDDRINDDFIVDVMLGGGTSYFTREDRDLVAEFIDAGYQYSDSYNNLATHASGQRILGLFAPVGLPWALNDTRKTRLSYLTKHAIRHLENDNGFFLLVEASQVDWAGHGNDIAGAMAEMHDLAATMQYLQEYVDANPDTLVVLTADHSTGGLTIGAKKEYRWSPEWLRNFQASVRSISENLLDQTDPQAYVAQKFGFALNESEIALVQEAVKIKDNRARESVLKKLVDERTNTGWTTTGHTGVDVQVFAMGPGTQLFLGQMDNTDIALKLFSLLGAKQDGDSNKLPAKSDNVCDFKTNWRC